MIFAALDYWHAGIKPPADRPLPGTPLYRFIVRRLIQSWRIPAGVATYYQWMTLPDRDTPVRWRGYLAATRHGLAQRTVARQWPLVRARIDAGQPATLGLVTVAGPNPLRLGHNHQVLACGYRTDGATVTIQVYDPNSGQDDGVFIRFDLFGPATAGRFAHNVNIGWPVRGFFLTAYKPALPPSGADAASAARAANGP